MKLSIIIPAYNAEPYLDELVRRLFPQLTKEVEVIIVDDGSDFPYIAPVKGFKVIRKQNGGVASARNLGLKKAKGEWIAFIDADDMISFDYVEKVMEALEEDPDYVYLSWETFGKGWSAKVEIKSTEQKFPPWNQCVWNRIYKRSMIGEVRFNEVKKVAEDAEFIRAVREKDKKKAFISEPIYFYRTTPRNSLTERFNRGELDMERIVYHYPHLPKDVPALIREIRKAAETAEVIVMTYDKNEELEEACMVLEPATINATELRGAYTNDVHIIPRPIKAQVVIYQGRLHEIGGVETWIYNFCKTFCDEYDIMVLHDGNSSRNQIVRLAQMVPVRQMPKETLLCNVFLNMRITDKIPDNVKAKKVVQLCHLCQMKENYKIQRRHDLVVFPSEAAKKSFADQVDGEVIQNLTLPKQEGKALILVTASRFTYEKGMERMKSLGRSLQKAGVRFIWFVFTDADVSLMEGMVKMEPSYDISPFVEAADYLVQLSDKESFCYSIVEALECGTAVLTTPLEVLSEIGFEEGQNGWLIPWEGELTEEDARKIRDQIPRFTYSREAENEQIKDRWRKILGHTQKEWKKFEGVTCVEIVIPYYDSLLRRMTKRGEIIAMDDRRAEKVICSGYGKLANNAKIDVL